MEVDRAELEVGVAHILASADASQAGQGAPSARALDEIEQSLCVDDPAGAGGGDSEAMMRLQSARLAVANEGIEELRAQLRAKSTELADMAASHKELQQQHAKLGKSERTVKAELERTKATMGEQKTRIQTLENELLAARKEGEDASRGQKATASQQHAKDVRLHRALEEVE
eukprot:1952022-Prymnesium_polylepis.1